MVQKYRREKQSFPPRVELRGRNPSLGAYIVQVSLSRVRTFTRFWTWQAMLVHLDCTVQFALTNLRSEIF